MRLSAAQVTLLRQAQERYLGNVASRGVNLHIAMEELVEDIINIVLPEEVLVGWRGPNDDPTG